MNKLNNLVSTALEYYDNNYEKYSDKFSKIHYVTFDKNDNENEHDIINFYDENKKIIYKSRYEILGLYVTKGNIWTWAWSVPTYKKNKTYISRKLLNYGTELEHNSNLFLKSELITSRYKITNPIQLDIHAGISSYLSKQPVIYKFYDPVKGENENIIEMGNMINIKENIKSTSYTQYFLFLLDKEQFD